MGAEGQSGRTLVFSLPDSRDKGSNAKKLFFCFDPKSPTQMGSLSAKNASKKFSRLGTFKMLKNYTISLESGLFVVQTKAQ